MLRPKRLVSKAGVIMSDDIKLKTVEEIKKDKANNCLPKDVKLMDLNGRIVFVRRMRPTGLLMPVSQDEQEKLYKKHVVGKLGQ